MHGPGQTTTCCASTPLSRRRLLRQTAAGLALPAGLGLVDHPSGARSGRAAGAEATPIPAAARGPAIPEKGYLVEEIRDRLYWVGDGSYQAMFLVTGEGVVVVDAPPTLGRRLLAAIAEVTDEPVTHVVYSHDHADHIGAARLFPAGAARIAHEETAALLRRADDPDRPVPTATFGDAYELAVGDQTLRLAYHGNNHQPGNIFVHAPRQRVLMLVDVVFPGWVPYRDLASAKDVPGFVAAHDVALGYDFETFVGGHLTRLGTRVDVEAQRRFVHDLRANAAAALEAVDFGGAVQEVGSDNWWLLIDTYLDRVARHCANATLPEWRDRLGGADVYTLGHCSRMVESLRVD